MTIAYYYGFSAADTDTLSVWDVTTSSWVAQGFFNNQTTAVGTTETLSGVAMGDVLELELYNESTNTWLTSDPSSDPGDAGVSHAYVTWYSANPLDSDYIAGIPAGAFVGMEDLGAGQNSDYDYNDDQYVVTGVSTYTGAGQPVPVGNRTSGSAGSGTPDAARLALPASFSLLARCEALSLVYPGSGLCVVCRQRAVERAKGWSE